MKNSILQLLGFLGIFILTACGNRNYEPSNYTEQIQVEAQEIATNINLNEDNVYVQENNHEYNEIVGKWLYLGIPWFIFNANGTAQNLQDGEFFRWNEDGSLNAVVYESWSLTDNILTINWETGDSFTYNRAIIVDSDLQGNASQVIVGGSNYLVGEWLFNGTPWFRFNADGTAQNLQDGENFRWNEDGSLDALLYESWSLYDNTLTITWRAGLSFTYHRTPENNKIQIIGGDYSLLIGEWSFYGIPWFRFNADGTAQNLQDGEFFKWHTDGTLEAIIYESWSIKGNTLTINWETGISFEYTRELISITL
jgi:protein-disulfide isomerase-like protein with CxxC motif